MTRTLLLLEHRPCMVQQAAAAPLLLVPIVGLEQCFLVFKDDVRERRSMHRARAVSERHQAYASSKTRELRRRMIEIKA